MSIDSRHVVLLAVDHVAGRPNGKTYIQKLCYFVQRLTNVQLGFRAHYYGPYSDQVSDALAYLSGTGLVSETRRGSGIAGAGGWEIARHDYDITDDGRAALARLDQASLEPLKEAIKRILDAGDLNYVDLSFAAKTDWILDSESGPMTYEGIAGAATRFNWEVSGTDVKKASGFLAKLGLVQLQAHTSTS